MKKSTILFLFALVFILRPGQEGFSQKTRVRDHGIQPGVMSPGPYNAITDVPGVTVGHKTLIIGEDVRTGVTAIIPHQGNIFRNKVPAAIYVGNGYGKLAGSTQIKELGNLETPVILTNTLSVPRASDALIDYTLSIPENNDVQSVNPVVGETNDGYLNDIRGRHVTTEDILEAIHSAKSGPVEEGSVGAGTGTICYSFKGGISSNGSGDYVIAFSTFEENFIRYKSKDRIRKIQTISNGSMSPFFMAVIEATEEAILNSMFAAKTVSGRDGHTVEALPIEKLLEIMKKYSRDGIK